MLTLEGFFCRREQPGDGLADDKAQVEVAGRRALTTPDAYPCAAGFKRLSRDAHGPTPDPG